ncbi:MAG: 3-isopropylmalate dehydratase small subunit [Gammaproteobacteria bacterium]|jgi:3-isopropylmalate/(R)-2-methylmalate dehydratase small subunit|tara:strand:- start:1058 stop:1693 length:636 start_codon:yes stop_codon:yes gene_type:complete
MKKFTEIKSTAAFIDRKNIDTDAIIPKQYLKAVTREGFGENLFDDWRYLEPGNLGDDHSQRKKNPDFFLYQKKNKNAKILVVGDNFGCGSSREHAVWALMDYGFEVVISTSFADIFYNNCFKNGLLPIFVDKEDIQNIITNIEKNNNEFIVNLKNQSIICDDFKIIFEIDSRRKEVLLEGIDDISETLKLSDKIKEYENKKSLKTPWLFND